jgi:hypothetical protein
MCEPLVVFVIDFHDTWNEFRVARACDITPELMQTMYGDQIIGCPRDHISEMSVQEKMVYGFLGCPIDEPQGDPVVERARLEAKRVFTDTGRSNVFKFLPFHYLHGHFPITMHLTQMG